MTDPPKADIRLIVMLPERPEDREYRGLKTPNSDTGSSVQEANVITRQMAMPVANDAQPKRSDGV